MTVPPRMVQICWDNLYVIYLIRTRECPFGHLEFSLLRIEPSDLT